MGYLTVETRELEDLRRTKAITWPGFSPAIKQALAVYYKRCEYRNEQVTDRGRYDGNYMLPNDQAKGPATAARVADGDGPA